jgi:hypothetical protein
MKYYLFVLIVAQVIAAAPYLERVPKFNRLKSNAMVREIAVPTLANLDFAAYNANPILAEPQKFAPKKPPRPVTLQSITFGGLLTGVCDSIGQTPLTPPEREAPLAWKPLVKRLREVVKDPALQNFSATINGYKWADASIFMPYQEIATAYLHETGAGTEMWVKIEFSPWVSFLAVVNDNDDDGYRELYARVADSLVAPAVAWIRGDYQHKVLSRADVVDWVTELNSYWYPTKNTDAVDQTGYTSWPNQQTEKAVAKTMRGVTIQDPVAVVRGRPFAKPIYNVYIVPGSAAVPVAVVDTPKQAALSPVTLDSAVSENFTANQAGFSKELLPYGSFAAWSDTNKPVYDAIRSLLAALPAEQMGIAGKDGWLFFRKSLEYTLAGDLTNQKDDKNPLPNLRALKQFCDSRNINLLFVVAPEKSEVYYDKLPCAMPQDPSLIINPWSRKILKDIQDAGIEVIDLLPRFLAAKRDDAQHAEALHQKQDTHWTTRGMQIAADLLAKRIRQYAWFNALPKTAFTTRDTATLRQGDIVDRLPESQKAGYPAIELKAQQVVRPDGTLNAGRKTDPIILMGDSYTGVFETTDCKSAGLGSHIAARTGVPVDIITSWGGGPMVGQTMARVRASVLDTKRLVVFFMTQRDLYNYGPGWQPIPDAKAAQE